MEILAQTRFLEVPLRFNIVHVMYSFIKDFGGFYHNIF